MGDGKHMQPQHAGEVEAHACHVPGPFDVVLMDMTLNHLLHALLQVRANACIFTWFSIVHLFILSQCSYIEALLP